MYSLFGGGMILGMKFLISFVLSNWFIIELHLWPYTLTELNIALNRFVYTVWSVSAELFHIANLKLYSLNISPFFPMPAHIFSFYEFNYFISLK